MATIIRRWGLVTLGLLVGVSASFAANMLDEMDCNGGGVAFDLSEAIDRVEKRLVGCVNLIRDEEVENHNLQASALRELQARLDNLESRVHQIEEL